MPIPASQLMNLFGGIGSALGGAYAGIRGGAAQAIPGLQMAAGNAQNYMQQIQADEELQRKLAAAGQVDALMQGAGMPQGLAQASIGAGINPTGLYQVLNSGNKIDPLSLFFAKETIKSDMKDEKPPKPEKPDANVIKGTIDELTGIFTNVTTDSSGKTITDKSEVPAALIAQKANELEKTRKNKPAEYRNKAIEAQHALFEKWLATATGKKAVEYFKANGAPSPEHAKQLAKAYYLERVKNAIPSDEPLATPSQPLAEPSQSTPDEKYQKTLEKLRAMGLNIK